MSKKAKRGGRVTPKKGRAPGDGVVPGFSNDERPGLAKIFARVLRGARRELPADADPLTAELWASHLCAVWHGQHLVDQDSEEVFCGGLIDHASAQHTPEALRVLRALAAVVPEPYRQRAEKGADPLAGAGWAEPAWAEHLGLARPTEAWLVSDPVDDDGVSVIVGFDAYDSSHALGVYVDHNLGGIAKDAFMAGPITEALAVLEASAEPGVQCRQISLTEAAARIGAAIGETDQTWQPPVTEDLRQLRALVLARLEALPKGGVFLVPEPPDEEEREVLLEEFLASDEAVDLGGPHGENADEVEHLAFQVLTYSLDYAVGTPLRFSPVMVEIFCCDWAPRKIAGDGDSFSLLPDVLQAWIRFVGRRRQIPEGRIEEAVVAVDKHTHEMLEAADDPEAWGPAKAMVLAMRRRGIDLSDPAAVQACVDEVNVGGGLDSLLP